MINLELGKIPPQALDIESAVLGAIMIEPKSIEKVISLLKPEMFYKEAHQNIYLSILNLYNNNIGIDMLTVTEETKKRNKLEESGGAIYIAELTNNVANASHLEHHSYIIAQKFIQRELIRSAQEIITQAYDDSIDVADTLDSAEKSIFDIGNSFSEDNNSPLGEVLHQKLKELYSIRNNDKQTLGITTGIRRLDEFTSGWIPSDLIILAARPSMGKTAMAIHFAMQTVAKNECVMFYSLEMSSSQLANRIISHHSGENPQDVRNASCNLTHIEKSCSAMYDWRMFIDDTPHLSLLQLKSKLRRAIKEHNIKFVIIDYLQLMTPPNKANNREQEISITSRGLKLLAKELNIPIMVLAQMNRSVETRANKRPILSDLRESGAIEQDADIVLFINRPDKYGITEEGDVNYENIVELICAKHRNGALFTLPLKTNDYTTSFEYVNLKGDVPDPDNFIESKTDKF